MYIAQLTGGEALYCLPSEVDGTSVRKVVELLMRNYSNLDRPKVATNDTYGLVDFPEFVEFELRLSDIWSINSKTTSYEYKGELWLQWVDCRLAFKSPERGGHVDTITMSYDTMLKMKDNFMIWTPVPKNLNADHVTSATDRERIIIIEPSGKVRARVPQRAVARCPMNLKDVPFDKHTCILLYASVEFLAEDVSYVLASDPAAFDAPQANADWKIGGLSANLTFSRVELSDGEFAIYSAVEASFPLEREPYFYLSAGVLPTILFWSVSYVGFFIHYSVAPSRVAIHITAILILVNHLQYITATLPTVSYRTWLSDYIVAHLVISVFHMVAFAAVYYSNWKLAELKEAEAAYESKKIAEALEQETKNADEKKTDEKKKDSRMLQNAAIRCCQWAACLDDVSRVASLMTVLTVNIYYLVTS